jgi:formate hydrogenlyase subunit 4
MVKLLRKGAVYSRSTGWVFRAGPVLGLAGITAAGFLVPVGGLPSLFAFEGDIIVFICLLGLARFFTVLAALDTASAFEGMGASRETFFSALTEPVLFLGLAVLAKQAQRFSLEGVLNYPVYQDWAATLLVSFSLFFVLLIENARIPVDDPATHLELTMIHEVMVLDHGGPDLAFIQYGAALKFWFLSLVLVQTLAPVQSGIPAVDVAATVLEVAILAVIVGVVESSMARLRLLRVPQLIAGAGSLAALAMILAMR